MLSLFYDFETSGMPLWDQPSDDEGQPHIVQAAAALVDTETRRTVGSINMIARPDGAWEIPDEVVEIHGITTDYAERVGLPEAFIVHCLWCLWEQSEFRAGHNESFDARIMRIALKRFYGEDEIAPGEGMAADIWKAGKAECTARLASPIMKMAATDKMRAAGRKHAKTPKLTEAFEFFFGVPMEDAHTAMADVRACEAVYFAIKDQEVDAEFDPKEAAKQPGYSGGKAGEVGKNAERPPNAGDDVSFLED